jgi:hypothetical protein
MAEIKQNRGCNAINAHKKAASETFSFNDVVYKNSSGYLTKAVATTPRNLLLGLIQREVLSTDSDYASNTDVPVLEFPSDPDAEFDMPVESGTPTQAYEGRFVDLNSEDGVNVDAQIVKCFKITRFISATVVRGKFVTDGERVRLVTYRQSFTRAQMTDGGSTSGTLALSTTIPAGAVFVQSMLTNLIGFTGDTSASIQVGDTGGDVDRYSTGTPSVFTTAAAGADLGVPSGTKFHADAVVPDVLITSNADFTNVSAGSADIALMWYELD